MNSIDEIMNWCEATGKSYWEYVEECEGPEIWDYLRDVWHVMRASVENGLENEGVLPGPLALSRKAASYNIKAKGYKKSLQSRGLVFSYALAVSERQIKQHYRQYRKQRLQQHCDKAGNDLSSS